jgi:competence protein ComEC
MKLIPTKATAWLMSMILGLGAVCTAQADAISSEETGKVLLQAESAKLSGEASTVADAGASGGAYVHLGKKGSVQMRFSVAAAGRYELVLRYRALEADKAQKIVLNGRTWELGFSRTADEWQDMVRVFSLAKGENTLEFLTDWGNMDLDSFRLDSLPRGVVAPLYELATVSPRETQFYRKQPRALEAMVQLKGHQIKTLQLGGKDLPYTQEDYPFLPDASWLKFEAKTLASLPDGTHDLRGTLEDGSGFSLQLKVSEAPEKARLVMVVFDIEHGKSTLLRLPDGTFAIIDTATEEMARERILPFLKANGITRIEHPIITHYHDDHSGGKDLLSAAVEFGALKDYKSFKTGESFKAGGLEFQVLNAWDKGIDENSRSMSLRWSYGAFTMIDGADNYALNQQRVLQDNPEWVRADVYLANHHYHGSLDVNFLRKVDPSLFIVSAQEAVYARGAFMQLFRPRVEAYLKANDGRLKETLITKETGTVVIRVFDGGRWTYETLRGPLTEALLGLR